VSGDFHCGDVRAMPFGEESFEVVIDGNCFHCLFGSDRSQCLQEVRRVLKRGGTFVLSSMCGDLKLDRFMPRYSESGRCLMRDGRPYRTLKPPREIEGELAVAGFRVLHREVSINPWWDHLTVVATI
jgi:ubiquinone/menaquinone biosynthesis C-methylase UbiE